jgi:hypothetical protein
MKWNEMKIIHFLCVNNALFMPMIFIYCNDRLMTTTTAALGLASLATLVVLAVAASAFHSCSAIGHLIV